MSNPDWHYKYFTEKKINEIISNQLAKQRQESKEYKEEIQRIIEQ